MTLGQGLWELLALAATIYVLVVAVVLIYEDRDPTTTLAWLLLLTFLPFVGIPMYVLFGRNWRWARQHMTAPDPAEAAALRVIGPIHQRWASWAAVKESTMDSDALKVANSIVHQSGFSPLPAETIDLFTSGAEKFAALRADIEAASDSIHLEYFIWRDDPMTRDLAALLVRKLGEGVEVRILYDFLGSFIYGRGAFADLRRAGAAVHADVVSLRKLNYRNHMKIAVIDGRIAYTGGMNMGREYIDGGPRFATWRDSHIRMTGPAVADLQRLFGRRWWYAADGKTDLFEPRYFPVLEVADPGVAPAVQAEYSSVETRWEAILNTLILAVTNANRRVWLQSPYFVPDQGLYDAMIAAALAGVDVRLMMTGVPDKKTAWWAAHSYFDMFLEAGGRVFLYREGFMHAKTVLVDDKLTSIGTCNLDMRSLTLHNEVTAWIHDEEMARRQAAAFENDLHACTEYTLVDVHAVGRVRRFRNSLMRLASKLL
jgi:cardiolipin synthase